METFSYRILGDYGSHEITSVELAAELRREGRLGTNELLDREGLRCLLGVMVDYRGRDGPCRIFSTGWTGRMRALGLDPPANDGFVGTPEERCEHFAKLLEAL